MDDRTPQRRSERWVTVIWSSNDSRFAGRSRASMPGRCRRGPMKGATMLATLWNLGIAASFRRPRVSDAVRVYNAGVDIRRP
jgi:hypothetical protein